MATYTITPAQNDLLVFLLDGAGVAQFWPYDDVITLVAAKLITTRTLPTKAIGMYLTPAGKHWALVKAGEACAAEYLTRYGKEV